MDPFHNRPSPENVWNLLTIPTRRHILGERVRGSSKICSSLEAIGLVREGEFTTFGKMVMDFGKNYGDLGPLSWGVPQTPVEAKLLERVRASQEPVIQHLLCVALGKNPHKKAVLGDLLCPKMKLSVGAQGVLCAISEELMAMTKAQRRFLLEDVVNPGEMAFFVHGQTIRSAKTLVGNGYLYQDNGCAYFTPFGRGAYFMWMGPKHFLKSLQSSP